MTSHDVAIQSLDDALKAARDLVGEITKARTHVQMRDYRRARSLISEAIGTASHIDVIYLGSAARNVEACK